MAGLITIALVSLTTGCVSVCRTGQLFLATWENLRYVTYQPCREGMFDPIRFLAFPFVAVGTVTFAPAYDIICLPIDLTMKAFGTRIAVIGEDGAPVRGADVMLCGERIGESWFSPGCHNTGVVFPLLTHGSVLTSKHGYYNSFMTVRDAVDENPSWSASVTVCLQRVERPIPLMVKRVEMVACGRTRKCTKARAGPCGRLRRCYATFPPNRKRFFGASRRDAKVR